MPTSPTPSTEEAFLRETFKIMADNEFRIESDSPVNSDLMFWSIAGCEALSRPSVYELRVLSKSDAIDPRKILGHAFDVVIEFFDADGGKHERHAKGHAVRVVRNGPVGRYFEYCITLRSWFWLLTKRRNSRIFQDKTVLQVVDSVFEDPPISQLKKVKSDHVIGVHEPRRYCVQHQEADYQFLSRLLEDEGIYYWFDSHDAAGTMHLSDASTIAHGKLPVIDTMHGAGAGASESRYNEIQFFKAAHQAGSGKFASRDSDFKAIKKKLVADKSDPDAHELADLEIFEFPGGYFSGDDTGDLAKVRMEELATGRQRFHGATLWPDVAVGKSFRYEKDPNGLPDADYLISGCVLYALHPGYEGVDFQPREAQEIKEELIAMVEDDPLFADGMGAFRMHALAATTMKHGQGSFLMALVPADQPYRPARLTPGVTMPGPQSAKVVGPEGEEIHADKYGRVKVHFHWDRYNEGDENSTCWVRVSQPWAGKGWGGYFIPRIGQEVIVDFLNGDPDRPVIVGRVYNDDQPIPFDSHTQSGFRTRSTPKGGVANFNEFRFDDKKGSEQVYLHAEKNLDSEVENDETHWVGHDRKKTIDHDESVEVKNNRTEKVGVDEKISIGANRTETVGANEDITIASNRTEAVGASETVTIGADRDHTVGANETRTVGASETTTIAASRTDSVGASVTQSIGAALTQTVGGAITISSGGPMTFNAAGGFTVVAPGGTKVIDNQLTKVGGIVLETYGVACNYNSMNLEANLLKVETTACTNALIGMKAEAVGMVVGGYTAVQKMAALEALSNATGIEMDGLKIFL